MNILRCIPARAGVHRRMLSLFSFIPARAGVHRFKRVGFYPSEMDFTLRRWILPFGDGFYPLEMDSTFRRWILPFGDGFYPFGDRFYPFGDGFYPFKVKIKNNRLI